MRKNAVSPAVRLIRGCALGVAAMLVAAGALAAAAGLGGVSEEEQVAESLAAFLRASRAVVSASQGLINRQSGEDKGLTGEVVVDRAVALYEKTTGTDPRATDPESREGRLLRAQIESVREVMDENQDVINNPSLGFKGFVPATFARLVNERFMEKMGVEAEIKVTAPTELVRNRRALPDEWEVEVIDTRFLSPDWPEGQAFSEWTEKDGREAFRVLVPEYYTQSCLSCHGEPKGDMDVTGYPKEGGKLGDLGGAISITLFR